MDDDTIEIIEYQVAEAKCGCGWTESATTIENAILLATEHRQTHDGVMVVRMRKAHKNDQWYQSPR